MKNQVNILLVTIAVFLITGSKLSANNMMKDSIMTSEDRHVAGFTSISSGAPIDFNIIQGETESINIKVPDKEMLKFIKTESNKGILIISTIENGKFNFNNSGIFTGGTLGERPNKIIITIKVRRLNYVNLQGSAIMFVNNTLSTDNIALNIEGSASFKGTMKTGRLNVKLSGSASLTLSGRSNTANINMQGSSVLIAERLVNKSVHVDMQGSTIAKVFASDEIIGDIMGNGNLSYNKDVANHQVNFSGNAIVKPIANSN